MTIQSPLDGNAVELSQKYFDAAMALGKVGRPQSQQVFLNKALDLHVTTGYLRVAFSLAHKLGDYAAAQKALDQIRPLLSESAKDQAWLERPVKLLKSFPVNANALLPMLEQRQPLAYKPIPGRICYMLHNSLPISSGGYATRAHGLAQGLTDLGYEVIAVTRPGFPVDTTGVAPQDVVLSERVDNIEYRRILEPGRHTHKGQHYVLEAAKALETAYRELRPQAVIAASNHLTSLPAQIAARALGIPFIYEVRGFWEVTRLSREPEFGATKAYADLTRLEALSAENADHVFTLTTPMREELVARGVPEKLISLLPNSCDPTKFSIRERDETLAAELGIPKGVPVIGYIGSFVQYEGLDHLAAACALLVKRGLDFRLMLVGNENVSGTDKGPITLEVERIAEKEGLQSRLIMPGRVPHEVVANYYSLIDIAPFPRKPQPVTEMVSPMKPLEAYAMGKTVVASNVRALEEMVEHNVTGMLFEKGNVEDLADTLARLVSDAALRERLGQAGRKWVSQERTWQNTAKRAEAILTALRVAKASHVIER